MPMTYSQFIWLIRHGIEAIVTIREDITLPKIVANNIDYFHLKVEDYGASHRY